MCLLPTKSVTGASRYQLVLIHSIIFHEFIAKGSYLTVSPRRCFHLEITPQQKRFALMNMPEIYSIINLIHSSRINRGIKMSECVSEILFSLGTHCLRGISLDEHLRNTHESGTRTQTWKFTVQFYQLCDMMCHQWRTSDCLFLFLVIHIFLYIPISTVSCGYLPVRSVFPGTLSKSNLSLVCQMVQDRLPNSNYGIINELMGISMLSMLPTQ